MKVRIVCYEDVDTWILSKFAKKLNEELTKLGVDSDIAKVPNANADINHHIIYFSYDGHKNSIDTLMITHIDSPFKLKILKNQLESAKLGVCMSLDTMQKLINSGIPKEKLYYINPAHDDVIKPRKIVIGILSKVHADGRKQENMLVRLCKKISSDDYCFKIMGSGWNEIVNKMKGMGFKVDYFEDFNYDRYVELVPTLDYFFYFSFDEGSMAFMDALTAGVPTIVTPQGYHLDAFGGISYPVKTFNDIVKTFGDISKKRKILVDSVSKWTWKNYAKEHIILWDQLISNKNVDILLKNKQLKRLSNSPKTEKLYSSLNIFNNMFTIKTTILYLTPKFIKNICKKIISKIS